MLLQYGADASVQDAMGWTALTFAAAGGHASAVSLLLGGEAGWRDRALIEASRKGHAQTAQVLLDAGTSPPNEAMLVAAGGGFTSLVRALIAHGGDPNAAGRPDYYGETPLQQAAARDHSEVLEVLLASGARVDARDGTGRDTLFFAAREGHAATLQSLLAHGADAHGPSGLRALYAAGGAQRDEVIRVLRQAGARGSEYWERHGSVGSEETRGRGNVVLIRSILHGSVQQDGGRLQGFSVSSAER